VSKVKKYLLIKKGDNLIPYDDEDSLAIALLKEGERVVATLDDARELWRHRKFFKLLTEVINHMPEQLSEKYPKPENLLDELKLQMGYYEKHYTLGGTEVWKPTSISFAKMGEKKFVEFVNDSKALILKYFLVGITEEQFDENFMRLIFK
jgi:hypothetical protein